MINVYVLTLIYGTIGDIKLATLNMAGQPFQTLVLRETNIHIERERGSDTNTYHNFT